jgi:hypothetical protein
MSGNDLDNGIRTWDTLASSVALAEPWFTVRRDTVRLPSGTVLDDFFVWESPHIVTVVPYTADGRFVLIRQYRHAIGLIDYQFPAGGADPGEPPEGAALREMEEETGFTGGELVHLYKIRPHLTVTRSPTSKTCIWRSAPAQQVSSLRTRMSRSRLCS